MLYVVRFSFDQQQKGRDDATGSFEVLVEAKSAEDAAEACKPLAHGQRLPLKDK